MTAGQVLSAGNHWWVPHNRWDLVAPQVQAAVPLSCAVIVPYFEQPESLRRLYAAIAAAELDPQRYELIVVDDGSATPPPTPPAELEVTTTILRQQDRGCRPGAARDLGASATTAECLVFLDADTLPSPAAIPVLARWPTTMPDALVVGARHHGVLDGWSPARTARWLDGSGEPPVQRPDPRWLTEAYEATGDLLEVDDRSYRFIISGVMACSRELYSDAGGFDTHRDRYGSEDWDLASRCFNVGAVLVHDPHAIAWHDEPDRADRDGAHEGHDDVVRRRHAKNEEWAWLADHVSDSAARGRSIIHRTQAMITRLAVDDPSIAGTASEIVAIESLLAAEPDMMICLPSTISDTTRAYVSHDPRIRIGEPTSGEVRRATVIVDQYAVIDWTADTLRNLTDRVAPGGHGKASAHDGDRCIAVATSTRALGRVRRAARHGAAASDAAIMDALFGTYSAETDHGISVLDRPLDLASMFDRPRRTARR